MRLLRLRVRIMPCRSFMLACFGTWLRRTVQRGLRRRRHLVRELEEVQKAHEGLGRNEGVKGGVKLEAEKEDGLNDSWWVFVAGGRLAGGWANDKSMPHRKEFTSQLITISAKKRYLQEPAVHVLLDLIDELPSEALKGHVVRAPGVHEWFEGAAESGNPDALPLALRIQEKISGDSSPFEKLLPNPFSSSKFFESEHLSSLMNCLKESTFSQPRVHTVWPVLARILLPDSVLPHEDATSITDSLKKQKKGRKGHPSEEETAKNLRNFVEVVIDGSLTSSCHDRKHLAFDILLSIIPKVPASLISHVLSYKLVCCLVDVLSTMDTWLYKIAENFLQKLSDWVKDDDVKQVGVVMSLQRHSNGKFDIVTRTKTVKTLMAQFQTERGCMLFI